MLRHLAYALALLVCASSAARAEDYKLSAGDKLDFSVAGSPDLRATVSVDVDGKIALPLIGEVPAAGRSLEQLRTQVGVLIGQKELPQRLPGSPPGATDVIWPDQVLLTISQYHPIYLNGDVAKPGEQKFLPGMTVRQALSAAGGFDILRFRMDNPFIEASQLRGEYESSWIDYAREQARLARIRAELGDKTAASALDPPLPASLLAQLRGTEAKLQAVDEDDYARQKAHLQALLAQQDASVDSLTQAHATEDSGTHYDQNEYNRIDDLYKKGTLPMTRVVEARRLMLLSATQAEQSQVELDHTKSERELARRKLESLDDTHRKQLLSDRQTSQAKLADIETRVRAIGDKLVYVGALKTQLGQGDDENPRLTLYRAGQPPEEVGEDTSLQPGDVVEVALRAPAAGVAALTPAAH